jgi:hypothetical protein
MVVIPTQLPTRQISRHIGGATLDTQMTGHMVMNVQFRSLLGVYNVQFQANHQQLLEISQLQPTVSKPCEMMPP